MASLSPHCGRTLRSTGWSRHPQVQSVPGMIEDPPALDSDVRSPSRRIDGLVVEQGMLNHENDECGMTDDLRK